MMFLYGVAIVGLVWWLARMFTRSNPAALAKMMKLIGGGTALGAAGLLALRGRMDFAIFAFGIAAWLFGWSSFGRGAAKPKAPGQSSRVRSELIEMELDHETGEMRGRVTPPEGPTVDLHSMEQDNLLDLYRHCLTADPDGARLLEAYMDRRFPGWRKDADPDPDARASSSGRAGAGAMSEQEAYEILGLQPGAGDDEIRAAHRSLMKKLHPDQGGSTYLASRVNRAKDVLLERHR